MERSFVAEPGVRLRRRDERRRRRAVDSTSCGIRARPELLSGGCRQVGAGGDGLSVDIDEDES
jgi:hypothetical protein